MSRGYTEPDWDCGERWRASARKCLRCNSLMWDPRECPACTVSPSVARRKAAEEHFARASDELDRAKRHLREVDIAEGVERRARVLEREPLMSVEELREAVADAARDHAHEAARVGPSAERTWTPFRALLARLAARAGATT